MSIDPSLRKNSSAQSVLHAKKHGCAVFFVAILLLASAAEARATSIKEADLPVEIRSIAVQHNGRVKSFDAFSRQTLRLVAGRESWKKRSAASVLWTIALDRSAAGRLEWIRLDLPELKKILNVDAERHYFTLNELAHGYPEVQRLAQISQAKRDKDERPTAVEQKAAQLLGRLHTANLLVSGELFTLIPPGPEAKTAAWASAFDSHNSAAKNFGEVLAACGPKSLSGAGTAAGAAAVIPCADRVGQWNAAVRAASAEANHARIREELFYLKFHPFQWAWMLYLAGFLVLTFAGAKPAWAKTGVALVVAGWVFHTLGLGMRVYILGRPPVSNMYESMVFMNWALMLFAFGFAAIRRTVAPLAAGALISALIEIYANLLPIDPSMDVLVPVLRSNYWLTIHVLTIVSSYGAFGLALALGHRHLISDRILRRWNTAQIDASARLILRVIEFGAILIGIGTVLGGVWANESWGRFWGWDPKETWALITLLGYLAIIHLRYFKKIGPLGLAVGTVVGFQLVLFTWYGVNFVLGRGLHSYGSGSGGMNWILYYLAAESVFLAWIFLRRK